MSTLRLWDRLSPWLRHPLKTAAAHIAFRYLDDHPTLEIQFKHQVGPPYVKYGERTDGFTSRPSAAGEQQ